GGMSRTLPYLSELQPEFFCEVSPELAAERGLEHLGWATIVSARAAIEARVLVTERMRPLRVRGRTVHQVGLPYHWGPNGLSKGDAANELLSIVLDPNVHIQESKAATCDIVPGRRPRGRALRAFLADYHARAGIPDGAFGTTGSRTVGRDGSGGVSGSGPSTASGANRTTDAPAPGGSASAGTRAASDTDRGTDPHRS